MESNTGRCPSAPCGHRSKQWRLPGVQPKVPSGNPLSVAPLRHGPDSCSSAVRDRRGRFDIGVMQQRKKLHSNAFTYRDSPSGSAITNVQDVGTPSFSVRIRHPRKVWVPVPLVTCVRRSCVSSAGKRRPPPRNVATRRSIAADPSHLITGQDSWGLRGRYRLTMATRAGARRRHQLNGAARPDGGTWHRPTDSARILIKVDPPERSRRFAEAEAALAKNLTGTRAKAHKNILA